MPPFAVHVQAADRFAIVIIEENSAVALDVTHHDPLHVGLCRGNGPDDQESVALVIGGDGSLGRIGSVGLTAYLRSFGWCVRERQFFRWLTNDTLQTVTEDVIQVILVGLAEKRRELSPDLGGDGAGVDLGDQESGKVFAGCGQLFS